jgi:hypothetical protein
MLGEHLGREYRTLAAEFVLDHYSSRLITINSMTMALKFNINRGNAELQVLGSLSVYGYS